MRGHKKSHLLHHPSTLRPWTSDGRDRVEGMSFGPMVAAEEATAAVAAAAAEKVAEAEESEAAVAVCGPVQAEESFAVEPKLCSPFGDLACNPIE